MAKVLIVDDEPGMRQVISKVLSPYFDTVLTAEDGKTALELAQKENPDMMMLDIRLPDMDGLDILAAVKAMNPNTPVIMLSGFGDVETAVELVRRGAFDYLSKPFKVDKLLELVKTALELNNVTPKKQIGPAISTEMPEIKEAPAKQPPQTKKPQAQSAASPSAAPAPAGSESVVEIKNAWIMAGVAALLVVAAGVFTYFKYSAGPEKKEYAISYSNPSALYCDGKEIWANDWMQETIFRHKLDDKLTLIASYNLPDLGINGITGDGKNLWTCSSTNKKIYKHVMDSTLTVAATYDAPGLSISSIYFDGENLWSMDYQQGKIYKHDIKNNLAVTGTFESFAANPCGMFKKGNSFYVGDSSTNMVYKVKADDFSIESVYVLPGYQDKKNHLAGLAYDGKYIYSCADGTPKIIRHSMGSLKPLGR
jgi:CheY-like chemotaxis protein/sugar lactone lactonase YvrE